MHPRSPSTTARRLASQNIWLCDCREIPVCWQGRRPPQANLASSMKGQVTGRTEWFCQYSSRTISQGGLTPRIGVVQTRLQQLLVVVLASCTDLPTKRPFALVTVVTERRPTTHFTQACSRASRCGSIWLLSVPRYQYPAPSRPCCTADILQGSKEAGKRPLLSL